MVARRGQIIACLIHQPDNGGAIVHGAVCRALDMVASIHQQHILALLLIALLEGCDGSIGQLRGFVIDVSMDIVGIRMVISGSLPLPKQADAEGAPTATAAAAVVTPAVFKKLRREINRFTKNDLLLFFPVLAATGSLPCAALLR